jgi:opacity protein-like surface antigen
MTMNKTIIILAILFSSAIISSGQSRFGISLKGGTNIPVGEFADYFNAGYTFEGTLSYNVTHIYQIYFTTGYQYFGFNDSDVKTKFMNENPGWNLEIDIPSTVIPVLSGFKWYLSIEDVKPFASFEFGYYNYSVEVNGKVSDGSNEFVIDKELSGWRLAYNLGLGVDVNVSRNIDAVFTARYNFSSQYYLDEINNNRADLNFDSSQFISILAGINFNL